MDADSYETQESTFLEEAEFTAISTLSTGEEALKQRLRYHICRHLLWMLPYDQKITIQRVHNTVEVTLE